MIAAARRACAPSATADSAATPGQPTRGRRWWPGIWPAPWHLRSPGSRPARDSAYMHAPIAQQRDPVHRPAWQGGEVRRAVLEDQLSRLNQFRNWLMPGGEPLPQPIPLSRRIPARPIRGGMPCEAAAADIENSESASTAPGLAIDARTDRLAPVSGHTSPHHVAPVNRLHTGKQLLAHAGANAVGADQCIVPGGGTTGELDSHLGAVLPEVREILPGTDAGAAGRHG